MVNGDKRNRNRNGRLHEDSSQSAVPPKHVSDYTRTAPSRRLRQHFLTTAQRLARRDAMNSWPLKLISSKAPKFFF